MLENATALRVSEGEFYIGGLHRRFCIAPIH